MEGRRRTIELDEDVAVALERGATERGLSLDDYLLDLAGRSAEEVHLSPDERAELEARVAEWERDRLGYDAEDIFDWLRDRVSGKEAPLPRLRQF